MKRLVLLLMVAFFLIGCGAAAERSEFYKHSAHYKNLDHLKFSWAGYRSPTNTAADKSQSQGWWGEPIQVPFGTK